MSARKRVLLWGVGISNADYVVRPTIDGKQVTCPFYRTWVDMLRRCYSENCLAKQPGYRGCTVCEEWHYFSKFKRWMEQQYWQGNQLDKDILSFGEKGYSPATCCFVDSAVNKLLTNCKAARGKYKQGVNFDQYRNKFRVQIRINGKSKALGYFKTEAEAASAYSKAKAKYIREMALPQSDLRVRDALLLHSCNFARAA